MSVETGRLGTAQATGNIHINNKSCGTLLRMNGEAGRIGKIPPATRNNHINTYWIVKQAGLEKYQPTETRPSTVCERLGKAPATSKGKQKALRSTSQLQRRQHRSLNQAWKFKSPIQRQADDNVFVRQGLGRHQPCIKGECCGAAWRKHQPSATVSGVWQSTSSR